MSYHYDDEAAIMSYQYEDNNEALRNRYGGVDPTHLDNFMDTYIDPNQELIWDEGSASYMAGGEELYRQNSSGGSSYNSAPSPGYYPYESPTDTIDPNLIRYGYEVETYDSSMSPQYAPRSEPSRPRQPSSTSISCDLCTATFKRRADLKRHKDHIHDSSSLVPIHCDYTKCARNQDPFKRKDHFRDHLRDFHREDVEPRGVQVGDEWYENRNTSKGWWRCGKCLNRIVLKHSGFNCPSCGGAAGKRRQEARRRHYEVKPAEK